MKCQVEVEIPDGDCCFDHNVGDCLFWEGCQDSCTLLKQLLPDIEGTEGQAKHPDCPTFKQWERKSESGQT